MPCFTQITTSIKSSDVEFGFYLFEKRNYDELFLLFNQTQPKIEQNTPTLDSLHYLLGMSHYYMKELEKSVFHLQKVSNSSVFYDKSTFFSVFDYAHLGEYDKAQTILEKYSASSPNSKYNEALTVNLAGIALLKRDLKSFDYFAKNFKFEQYYYTESYNQLMNVRNTLDNHKKKSPFVAGVFSAVIPGAGKWYAGQIGEALTAFFTVGIFSAITAENWVKNGFNDWKTITFGTIGSIFYIGNIYGSVASVKVYRNQFNDNQNHTILLGIHLPVRALFE